MGKKSSKKKQARQQIESVPSGQKSKKNPVKKDGFFKNKVQLISIGLVLLFTFLIYLPSLSNSYVYWDDDRNFIDNLNVNSESNITIGHDLVEIFKPSNHVIGNYNPLSIATFRIENALFGMEESSWKYWHLDNLLLHLLCIFLVFRIALLLKLNNWGAVFLALLFAIHPMRVESVVWLTERKDVLFASFYFAALFYYIKGKLAGNEAKHTLLIVILFVLSCLSKIQAVSLPLSMIAVDYYFDGKFNWKQILTKWHYFVISLLTGILGVYTLSIEGSIGGDVVQMNFFQRLFVGSYSYCVYIVKLFYPYELSPMYPYPATFKSIFYLSAIPFFAFVGLVIWAYLKKYKAFVFGVLFFTVNIMFLLQIVGAGQGFIADRFSYVAYFGFFFIAAFYFQKMDFKSNLGKGIVAVVALFLAYFSYTTVQQIGIWKNSETMWTKVIEYYPNTKLPWGNRANYLRDQGRYAEALSDYDRRLSLGQTDPRPFNSRAKLYFQSDNPDTLRMALQDYNKAIELEPTADEYYVNRASTYARLGDLERAMQDYNKAHEINPNNSNVYFNRSILHHMYNNFQKELEDIEAYLRYIPNNPDMISNLAVAKRLVGRPQDAEADFNRAIQLKASPNTILERAKNYIELRKYDEARQDVRTLQSNNIAVPQEILQILGM